MFWSTGLPQGQWLSLVVASLEAELVFIYLDVSATRSNLPSHHRYAYEPGHIFHQ